MVLAHRSDAYLWFLQYEVTKSTSTFDTPLDELQVHCMATSTAQVHNTLTSARAQTRPLDLELSTQTIRPDCFSPNSFTDPVIHSFLCAVYNPESSLGTKVQAITKFVESHAAQLSKVYTLKMFSYSILYESWRGFGFQRHAFKCPQDAGLQRGFRVSLPGKRNCEISMLKDAMTEHLTGCGGADPRNLLTSESSA